MTPSDLFTNKFFHLHPEQANKVLADLILTQNSYFPDRAKDMIRIALEIALNQSYQNDIPRLEALLESIATDEEYDYDNVNIWFPPWDLYG